MHSFNYFSVVPSHCWECFFYRFFSFPFFILSGTAVRRHHQIATLTAVEDHSPVCSLVEATTLLILLRSLFLFVLFYLSTMSGNTSHTTTMPFLTIHHPSNTGMFSISKPGSVFCGIISLHKEGTIYPNTLSPSFIWSPRFFFHHQDLFMVYYSQLSSMSFILVHLFWMF